MTRFPFAAAAPPEPRLDANFGVMWLGGVLSVRDAVLADVAEAIARVGMDLPNPTQVVLFHDQTQETGGDRKRQRGGWPAGKNPPNPRRRPCSRVDEDEGPSD